MNPAELIDLASGERFPLEESVTVGREGCDIVLKDELVSRRHAVIRVTASGLEIEDLGSRNATFVNGEQLRAPRALQPGDTVEIGDVRLRVEMAVTAAVTRAAPVVPTRRGAVAAPRGDVPPPEPEPQRPVPALALPASAPAFERGASPAARRRASAARRGGATAVSFAVIAATAAALIAYFADRGL